MSGVPEGTAALTTAVDSLEVTVSRLAERVGGQEEVIDRQEEVIDRQKRFIAGLILSLILDLFVTLGIAWNADRIGDLQTLSSVNTESNRVAQCGLMGLFFGSEKGIAESTTRTAEQKREALEHFAQLHVISDRLGCEK